MKIRRNELRRICDLLLPLCDDFGVYHESGEPLYQTVCRTHDSLAPGIDIYRNGSTAVLLRCSHPQRDEMAAILNIFLTEIGEKRALSMHALAKYKELSLIAEISEILRSSIDLDEILQSVAARCSLALNADRCSVITANDSEKNFFLRVSSDRIMNTPLWLTTTEGIAGRVFRSGKPLIVNDPAEHPDFTRGGIEDVRSLLCIPLKTKDKIVGVINVSNKCGGGFTSEDESLLATISALIAGVIETSRLMDEKIKNEKFAAIGQMAAGIVHDIKNPMSTIKGFAGLLADFDFSQDERRQYGGMIVAEVDRLVAMVEDLLAFTRGFRTRINPEPTPLAEFIAEIAGFLRPDFSARDIAIVTEVRYPGVVSLDREKFKRVMFNIAGNARDAMHDGGSFLLMTRERKGRVEIVLADTGTGVPQEIISSLFEPFVTRGKKSGIGLGLAVSRKIVEEHGGAIEALNGPVSGIEGFGGAHFIIRMPVVEDATT